MKLQEDSATLEFLAKELLNYFIKMASGPIAIQSTMQVLQDLSDELNNYYFFTKPYHVLSGNTKLAEDISNFKERIHSLTDSKSWNIEMGFAVVQSIYKFLNKNDWSQNAVNNNFTVALCIKMQADLQINPAINKSALQELLHGKNGKMFAAELENALGKIKTQHEQLKMTVEDVELVSDRERTISAQELESDQENKLMDATNMLMASAKPKTVSISFWSKFLAKSKAKIKEAVEEESQEESQEESSDEDEQQRAYLSLVI